MGTIFSGVGLASGIDIQALVDQLISVSARPRDMLVDRIAGIDAQRSAYLDISARVSAILTNASALKSGTLFRSSAVTSSMPEVLSARATGEPAPGSYSFIVQSLATTHQVVSRGFASNESALTPGTLTIESAAARVNTATRLDQLNGFAGVQRGAFELIDGDGDTVRISLGDAVTLNDVVDRVNGSGVDVRASLEGDHLVLTETGGRTLQVKEVDGGRVAADLGFGSTNRYSSNGRLTGRDLVTLAGTAPLSQLNDGNGVRMARAGGDFTISRASDGLSFTVDLSTILKDETKLARLNHGNGVELGQIRITTEDAAGQKTEFDIDLSAVETVGELKSAISGAAEGLIVTNTGSRLVISYADDSERTIEVEDLSGNAARDLGLAGSSDSGQIDGADVLFNDSMSDVLAAINHAAGNDGSVSASLDGARLVLDGGGTLELSAMRDDDGAIVSHALMDLGFAEGTYDGASSGRRLLAGVNSVLLESLNGGRGVAGGTIEISTGSGAATVDLSDAESLREVVERINAAAGDLGVEAGYDATGTRLVLSSLDGATPVTVRDVQGTLAADLGIDQTGAEIRGVNVQRQHISETTRLEDLNHGRGVMLGRFRITNSTGQSAVVDVGTAETLSDVIRAINESTTDSGARLGVTARINDTGDGLVLEDGTDGGQALLVEEDGGTTARDLNLLGEGEGGVIDGSYELRIDVSASDSLQDVMDRINEAGGLASAAIINDGSGISPYRLQITSTASGTDGALVIDGASMGLDFTTLSKAQDARVLLGTEADGGVLLTSSSNTITEAVPGLTLDLTAVSEEPVTVTVSRDTQKVADTLSALAKSFNDALDRINEVGTYDAETEKAGVLLGEGTLDLIESRVFRLVTGLVPNPVGSFDRLADVGLVFEGGKVVFDEERFNAALESDPDAVAEFFTAEETGVAGWMEQALKEITDAGGLIEGREEALGEQRELLNGRVENMNELLDRKAERLTREFLAMEEALAELQSQQSALSQLAALVPSA